MRYLDDGKKMAERVTEPINDRVNKNAKDSVFVDLFSKPEYILQLYKVFHPEDNEATAEDITIVTLESLLLKDRYNDLGFMVSNRLMILVEAQSTWSVNIVVRFLLYVADTYNRYIEKNGLDLYNSRVVELPAPELYVIYTGSRKNCPDSISLSEDVFRIGHSDIEVKAAVIRDSTDGDILDQYITFTRIFDKQIKSCGSKRDAVEQTLRICRNENILREYLREEEVADIMFTFVDREKALERMLAREREETRAEARAEGLAEGRAEGLKEGRTEGRMEERGRGKNLFLAMEADGRLEDYSRAMKDDALYAQYLHEYGIE